MPQQKIDLVKTRLSVTLVARADKRNYLDEKYNLANVFDDEKLKKQHANS
ncbi:hypothetical protein T10_9812 [Trichinella papuae]|uniref:Uncharacterized protein n=1 Tax=Trichinella papuae TaxID=268474 RepID=A0A0V1LZ87_9BILA|nr:hypothetical protein T10_9812 [Trichinella papuae]